MNRFNRLSRPNRFSWLNRVNRVNVFNRLNRLNLVAKQWGGSLRIYVGEVAT